MSTPVKEQYIIDRDGNKTGIILSIEQYEQMLEDLHDLAIIAERRSKQTHKSIESPTHNPYRIYNPQIRSIEYLWWGRAGSIDINLYISIFLA